MPPTSTALCGARILALLVAAVAAMAGCHAEPQATNEPDKADRAWVQLTGRGPEARLVTLAAACPKAVVDGKPLAMQTRAAPSPDFPVTACSLLLPPDARHARIGRHVLVLPKPMVNRIVLFGDTGCRLKGHAIQLCDNPSGHRRDWPFAEVAQLAAAHRPDLVVHVGDYYYRESPCPPSRSGCKGSPWGDNWTTWDADFFAPAAPLLAAAPWVMVRGNHESCSRGWQGWFRLLDAGPAPLPCPAVSAPYAVSLGGLNLYVLDSADAEDKLSPPDAVEQFAAQLDALAGPLATEPGWIVTHRPIWGLAPVVRLGPIGPLETSLNATEEVAVHGHDLSAVQMVVSGHVHHFASFAFGQQRPAQLIVGTGGDIGERGDTPAFRSGSAVIDGMTARDFAFERYGFLVLDRQKDGWAGGFYNLDDRLIARCRLASRELACAPAS